MALNLTLRTKGVIAILILIGYLGLIAIFLSGERRALFSIAQQMEANHFNISLVEPIVNALARSMVESQAILNARESGDRRPVSSDDLGIQLEALNVALEDARMHFPSVDEAVERFRRAVGALKAYPSADHLAKVRDSEQLLVVQLQDVLATLRKLGADLGVQYRDKHQFISIFAVAANVVGAVASVGVILVFFTRLARDINRLKNRASQIVAGYDGAPLPNTRNDEMGGLIDAVNRLQVDLRRWEQQLEVTRQQRFHQEKMAAVGSLASAIAHEVSNPIAAISGVAQFIADESADDARPQSRQINEFARQIMSHVQRVARIMRQMATLTAPRSPEPELLDLNALIESTCGFIRYDRRFHRIRLEEDLAPHLPAVTAVSDHLTQILMNLLINAADSFEGITDPSRLKIVVATRVLDDGIRVSVTDSGRGMTTEVLERAFDESFTTKPAGQGRGIGLFVCKSLIEKTGGRIGLASAIDEGTTASIHIPLRIRERLAA
jgi:two-component system, NtrC family, sensor kinase